MMELIKRLWKEEEGQGLIEYAILIGLIVVGVIGIIFAIGTWVNTQFTTLRDDLQNPEG